MKFIKALQKAESEQLGEGSQDETEVRSGQYIQIGERSEDFITNANLKIGAPDLRVEEPGDAAASDSGDSLFLPEGVGDLIDPSGGELPTQLEDLPEFSVDPARVNPHLVSITQPNSQFAEEYRSLRTQIMHSSQRRQLRSIVIASVGAAEGKSVTALNLCWLMAQTEGMRALLIDGDLRKPSLAKYLGFEVDTGFSQVLSGELRFKSSLIRVQPAGLYLLPGGPPRSDVAELLSGPRFGVILEEAQRTFDYVVIDAPPLGIFTDAAVLINQADTALLVVRAGHTKYKDIERKLEGLPREKMIGMVLNQSDEVLAESNYYDYAYSKNYLT